MNIEWIGPPAARGNYYVGRDGHNVELIVDHWMDGTIGAAIARFSRYGQQVSAHYLIAQDGRVLQLVSDDDTAYHAGRLDVNYVSIGIEHEASPTESPSDALYESSAALHALLAQRHSLTLEEGVTVKPHRAIVATQCPGTLDIGRILEEAMGVSKEEFAAYQDDVRNTFTAIKEVLASLASGAARDETRDAALAQAVKDTEVKAVVEAILSVKPEALKPAP